MVGGDVERFQDAGAAMAAQALRLIAGERNLEPVVDVPSRPVADWRQMRRFGLDPDLLPADTLLEVYDPSAWERYRRQILIMAAFVLLQSATIAALFVQGRRVAAEREVAVRRIELAHLSRVAQMGELSGPLAHELNPPLTAILANAEAGTQLAALDPPDMGELTAILADIAEDDRRAAGIIVELRRLMINNEISLALLDLNRTVDATLRLARSELLVRGVSVQTRFQRDDMSVKANRPQLKQVVLNLVLNAADAVADQPAERRVITVTTELRQDGWRELAVSDRGPGFAEAVADDPFRPFVTTKVNGLGLGLSICRTIVQAHGGTLVFDTNVAQGARAVLALPPP